MDERKFSPQKTSQYDDPVRRCLAILIGVTFWCVIGPIALGASESGAAPGRSGVVQPPDSIFKGAVRSDPVSLSADAVTVWKKQEGDNWLFLRGAVHFSIGEYSFASRNAVVRIRTSESGSRKIRRIWVYFDHVRPVRGQAQIQASAPRLLTTVVTTGGISLSANTFRRSEDGLHGKLVQEAQKRIARRMAAVNERPRGVEPLRASGAEANTQNKNQAQGQSSTQYVDLTRANKQATASALATQAPGEIDENGGGPVGDIESVNTDSKDILPAKGTVHFDFDRIVVQKLKQDKTAVEVMGHVRIIYQDDQTNRIMSLKADRAVLFLNGESDSKSKNGKGQSSGQEKNSDKGAGAFAGGNLKANQVGGIYLEGHAVASDGKYTLRSPRIYYSVSRNKAVLLDAVFYHYDIKRRIPLYIRADMIRQESAQDFSAENASFTTSAFTNPFIALRAGSLELTGKKDSDGQLESYFVAKDITINIKSVPMFYWPKIAGSAAPSNIPLIGFGAGYSSDNGMQVITKWDLFSLASINAPQGVSWTGNIDYRGDHGAGIGTDFNYHKPNMHGRFLGYTLPYDTGTDKIDNRKDVGHDGDLRGFFLFQHRHDLENGWQLSLEVADVSDPTFLDEFYPRQSYATKPYETSFFLKKQKDDWDLNLLVKGRISDFLPQTDLLQSRGFSVDKMPQLTYRRTGTSFFNGLINWFSENSISRVRARFGEDTPAQRGFSNYQSLRLFGIPANTSFADAAAARNFPTDWRFRFDTRQELDIPMKVSFINITPYVTGRLTAYNDDFGAYNGGNNDRMRLWGQVGAKINTQLHRTYEMDSDLLNLHKLRHIIEPNIDMFASGTTLNSSDLPIYDPDVEGISTGTGIKIGVTNIFQTQRGGPGQWRNVNWLTVKTYLVLYDHVNDANNPFPRFFSYRPEYSVGGNHFYTQLKWMVSDTLGLTGEMTDSLETNQIVQWRVGATMNHSPDLTSFISYEELDPMDSNLLIYGFNYKLSAKYRLGVTQSIDFSQIGTQVMNAWLQRDFPQFQLRLVSSLDELEGDFTVGVMIVPKGLQLGGLMQGLFQ